MSDEPLLAATAEASSGRFDTERRIPNSDEGVSEPRSRAPHSAAGDPNLPGGKRRPLGHFETEPRL